MSKLFYCFCLLLYFLGGEQSWGQENNIESKIDSINMVQAKPLKKEKPVGYAYVIKISSQEQFDGINDAITNAIAAGMNNIQVRIAEGVYYFHENHILRKNEKAADVSITISGKRAVITSDAHYLNSRLVKNPWGEITPMDSIIEVLDKDQKTCRIPYNNKLSNEEKARFTKVQITQWFRAPVYNVTKIDERGIYFIAPGLFWDTNYANKGYNVNYDYLFWGKIPRFRLYNKTKESGSVASMFVNLDNCSYRLFAIKGIEFISNNSSGALIGFNNISSLQIMIKSCTFNYIRGYVVNASGTGNIVFDNNTVRNTFGNELRFVNNCHNVRVTKNLFEDCGQSIGNTFCITCWESSYFIANNTFKNFGYGAIGVGVWHGFEKKYYSGGIIEYNEIYFTPIYFAEAWKHMLMDSGAIYTWTQNDNVIIRYNYIHDYTGPGDNRGIFCDDGANNLMIYGNVVLNTPNSYSIDSRMVKDKTKDSMNNANNYMAQNIVGNGVRFQGQAGARRHVVKGSNYVVTQENEKSLESDYLNLESQEEDLIISNIDDKLIRMQIKKCKHK